MLHRAQPGDLQLIASGGPGFGLHFTLQDQGGLQGEAVELLKVFLRQVALDQDPLGQAGAVPHHQETHLAAGAQMVDPAAQGDGLPHVGLQVGDSGYRR